LEITSFEIMYGEEGPGNSGQTTTATFPGAPTAKNLFSGLQPSHTYTFRARAMNRLGWGPWSAAFTDETPNVPEKMMPWMIRQVNATTTSITFEWDAPDDNLSPILEYVVTVNDQSYNVVPEQTEMTVYELIDNTNYQLTMYAVNDMGAGEESAPVTMATGVFFLSGAAVASIGTVAGGVAVAAAGLVGGLQMYKRRVKKAHKALGIKDKDGGRRGSKREVTESEQDFAERARTGSVIINPLLRTLADEETAIKAPADKRRKSRLSLGRGRRRSRHVTRGKVQGPIAVLNLQEELSKEQTKEQEIDRISRSVIKKKSFATTDGLPGKDQKKAGRVKSFAVKKTRGATLWSQHKGTIMKAAKGVHGEEGVVERPLGRLVRTATTTFGASPTLARLAGKEKARSGVAGPNELSALSFSSSVSRNSEKDVARAPPKPPTHESNPADDDLRGMIDALEEARLEIVGDRRESELSAISEEARRSQVSIGGGPPSPLVRADGRRPSTPSPTRLRGENDPLV